MKYCRWVRNESSEREKKTERSVTLFLVFWIDENNSDRTYKKKSSALFFFNVFGNHLFNRNDDVVCDLFGGYDGGEMCWE